MKLLVEKGMFNAADHMLFRLFIAAAGSFMAFGAAFGNGVVAQEMNIGLFYMLAIMSTEVASASFLSATARGQMVAVPAAYAPGGAGGEL